MGKLFVILLAIVSFGCATQTKSKNLKQGRILLQLGTSQLRQGQYPQALNSLLQAKAILPPNAVLENNLGLAYYVRGKNKIAIKHLQSAIELNPKYTEARNNLASIYIQENKYNKALALLNKAKEDLTYPHPEKIFSNLGIVQFQLAQYRPAFESLKKSLKIRRDDCDTYTFYGRSLYELKRFELSSSALLKAAAICKENPEPARYYSALSFIEIGDVTQANTLLEEIIKLSTDQKYRKKAHKALTLIKKVQ